MTLGINEANELFVNKQIVWRIFSKNNPLPKCQKCSNILRKVSFWAKNILRKVLFLTKNILRKVLFEGKNILRKVKKSSL